LSIIIQTCGNNQHFLVCITICYQPMLAAWSLYFVAVQYGRFLPCDAMLSAVYVIVVCLSICLRVCVSVTLQYCIKMAKCRITQIMPHDRSGTLVYTDKHVAQSLYHSRASCIKLTHHRSIYTGFPLLGRKKFRSFPVKF